MNKIEFDIEKLIEFYDVKDSNKVKPASSITAVIGEDLVAGLFKHYLLSKNKSESVQIIEKIKAAGKKGKMLDRWIVLTLEYGKSILYQTEIKNWSAHSLGGKSLGPDYEIIKKEGVGNLNKIWGINSDSNNNEGGFKDDSIGKVLLKMNTLDCEDLRGKDFDIIPLVCFWMPVCDDINSDEPFFFSKNIYKRSFCITSDKSIDKKIKYNSILEYEKSQLCEFEKVYFFSASMYLRSLKQNNNSGSILIESDNIVNRISHLNTLIKNLEDIIQTSSQK